MLGRNAGVGKRIKKIVPNIIVWHCLNHRLQLALDDAIVQIKKKKSYHVA